jgi:hypothetical protein
MEQLPPYQRYSVYETKPWVWILGFCRLTNKASLLKASKEAPEEQQHVTHSSLRWASPVAAAAGLALPSRNVLTSSAAQRPFAAADQQAGAAPARGC